MIKLSLADVDRIGSPVKPKLPRQTAPPKPSTGQPSKARPAQAEGLTHISPGQRPGFMAPKISRSAESAFHRGLPCAPHPFDPTARRSRTTPLIPYVPFIELHVVFLQEIAVLLLEGPGAMMFFLTVNVAHQVLQLAPADGKIAVASLPEECRRIAGPGVLIQAEEVFLIFSRSSAWLMVRARRAAIWT